VIDDDQTAAVLGSHRCTGVLDLWHDLARRAGNDGFRRAFLAGIAGIAGRRFVAAPDTDFVAVREARLDRLGDLIAEHADTDALWRLVESGPPAGLPLLPPGAGVR
jgi:adenosylcobyric acid synthase